MPLRAFIDGREVVAPLVSDLEWEQLREAAVAGQVSVILPCCQSPGHLRVSSLGNKHFVHSRKHGCDWKPESWQHLKAKSEIVIACKEAGYEASTEVAGSEWRADVLASKGSVKIAFEVQWSPQSFEDTVYRQTRYARDNVRGCWFFRQPPFYVPRHDIPAFRLTVEETKPAAIWLEKHKKFVLGDFVKALLRSQVKFCAKTTYTHTVFMGIQRVTCEHCGSAFYVYDLLEEKLISHCGIPQEIQPTSPWNLSALSNPEIIAALKTYGGDQYRWGTIKLRSLNGASWLKRLTFGCPACDNYFALENCYPMSVENDAILELKLEDMAADNPHWCYSEAKDFCL